MRKGEIARNEQFLLFPQCFLLNQITVSPFVHFFDIICLLTAELEEPKIGISGKGLSEVQMMISYFARIENILDKGENANFQHFILFTTCSSWFLKMQ